MFIELVAKFVDPECVFRGHQPEDNQCEDLESQPEDHDVVACRGVCSSGGNGGAGGLDYDREDVGDWKVLEKKLDIGMQGMNLTNEYSCIPLRPDPRESSSEDDDPDNCQPSFVLHHDH